RQLEQIVLPGAERGVLRLVRWGRPRAQPNDVLVFAEGVAGQAHALVREGEIKSRGPQGAVEEERAAQAMERFGDLAAEVMGDARVHVRAGVRAVFGDDAEIGVAGGARVALVEQEVPLGER